MTYILCNFWKRDIATFVFMVRLRYLQSDPPRCQRLNVVLLGPDVVFSEVRDSIQLHWAFIYARPDNARNLVRNMGNSFGKWAQLLLQSVQWSRNTAANFRFNRVRSCDVSGSSDLIGRRCGTVMGLCKNS